MLGHDQGGFSILKEFIQKYICVRGFSFNLSKGDLGGILPLSACVAMGMSIFISSESYNMVERREHGPYREEIIYLSLVLQA